MLCTLGEWALSPRLHHFSILREHNQAESIQKLSAARQRADRPNGVAICCTWCLGVVVMRGCACGQGVAVLADSLRCLGSAPAKSSSQRCLPADMPDDCGCHFLCNLVSHLSFSPTHLRARHYPRCHDLCRCRKLTRTCVKAGVHRVALKARTHIGG